MDLPLTAASVDREAASTQRIYETHRDLRSRLFRELCRAPSSRPPAEARRISQTILDRALFLHFAEARGLLARGTLAQAGTWRGLLAVFRSFAEKNGLFAPRADLDALLVEDATCAAIGELSAALDVDGDEVSVAVLGHVFERSLRDLEAGAPRRSAEGVFYTPAFVSFFIVEQTLGRVFDDRWNAVVARHGPEERATLYEAYRDELRTIRVLDPSCGSGAFLIAALHALRRESERVNAVLEKLCPGQASTFDALHENLFGVDVNAESVEITKLSLWLEAAERGRALASLDRTIQCGNSVVRDPKVDALAFDWTSWPQRFDVVLGNPPYVRQERLAKATKEHLEASYRAHHGMADLFVYFFELGISLLSPGGRLGFVVANKWLKSGYGAPLRGLLAKEARIEVVVDFGHAPIFPDADAFPCIVTLAKPERAEIPAEHVALVTAFPREKLDSNEIPSYVARNRYPVPQARLGSAPWRLEPAALDRLMTKIHDAGTPLAQYAGVKPYRGLLTGYNEAFSIDDATKRRLCEEDGRSAEILRPWVRGQDVERWSTRWGGKWLIFTRRGIDIERYPAVARHLARYRPSLEPRPPGSSGAGRKPGTYKWYELQDAGDYWELLESPKILYQEIQFHPAYALDASGLFLTNKVFFLPTSDAWLLAVLNAPLMWWYCFRYLPHMKDETLSPVGAKMQSLPIAAPPSAAAREKAEALVHALVALKKADDDARAAALEALHSQYAVEEPGKKLADFASLDADAFVKEVKRRRPEAAGKPDASFVSSLREMHGDLALPIRARRREALALERRLGDLVDDAYGLGPEDAALVSRTAPPRMPYA